MQVCRSSSPEAFCRKDFLRDFAKFTGKHLFQSLFFDKAVGLRPAALLEKRLWHCEFFEISKNTFFTEHLRLLFEYDQIWKKLYCW